MINALPGALKCTPIPVNNIFLENFWAFAPEPSALSVWKKILQTTSINPKQLSQKNQHLYLWCTQTCLLNYNCEEFLSDCLENHYRGCIQSIQTRRKKNKKTFWTLVFLVPDLITLTLKKNAVCRCLNLLSVLFCSMTLWSYWMAAGLSLKSIGVPANLRQDPVWIIRSLSIKPDSSSTWTQGCGTWRFIMMDGAWRQCPTTPSSRVSKGVGWTSAAVSWFVWLGGCVMTRLEDFNFLKQLRLSKQTGRLLEDFLLAACYTNKQSFSNFEPPWRQI